MKTAPMARACCYLVAITTGLRRSELSGLRPEHVDLEAGAIELPAQLAKNRTSATLPLPRVTVEALRRLDANRAAAVREAQAWSRVRKRRRADDPLLPSVPDIRTFYRDLKRAEIERETREGRIDFHALRVTFCRRLQDAGAGLALAQDLMRHSTPELTSNTYTPLDDVARRAAVERVQWPEV